ncbi:coenzyme Q-binding protein COQ10 homolog, mitochondrial-like [Sesamum indicum]|uniref:Coenzyme Q-binding protein COQ10 homolog, mitochondrial-like n=1 Tax=Sesamum indicum TaxID=4182 RepID=A0A6I9SUW5_SESIN|nr:coenzyme Q-binding protein COQ10 homolog, mitochondrial-like [Sesamum indicum]
MYRFHFLNEFSSNPSGLAALIFPRISQKIASQEFLTTNCIIRAMSKFKPASKTLGRLVFGRNLFRQRMTNYNQIRCLNSISGSIAFSSSDKLVGGGYRNYYGNSLRTSEVAFQKRGFLGCVDGEVRNMLSKVYEERRVLGYSPEQLFNVVAAVDMYQDFLPWCERSKIIRHNRDGTFDAELEIGFKFLAESYVSHVELSKPKSIKTTSYQSTLFDHLINAWEFNPGPVPGTCNLYFLVDFKFKSPLYRQIANMFFNEVVSRLVGSFSDRCQLIYGPAVPVLENSYDQRA